MALTRDEKYKLRQEVKEKIMCYDYKGKKIELPEELLEELMFDVNEELGIKKIGFVSDYLYRINLSKLNMDNVSLDNEFFGSEMINLKNTNIKIDFTKTPEYKKDGRIVVSNINFENVDLGNNDLDDLTKDSNQAIIRHCNFAHTHLNFTGNANILFTGCDFNYSDFSHLDLEIDRFSNQDAYDLLLTQNNLKFERSNISYTEAFLSIKGPILKYQYNNLLVNPYLAGCYFEDVLLGPSEQISPQITDLVYASSDAMTNKKVITTLQLINNQIHNN